MDCAAHYDNIVFQLQRRRYRFDHDIFYPITPASLLERAKTAAISIINVLWQALHNIITCNHQCRST
ncbi:hypothetical protein DL122_22450 [Salmonella enterica subsp. salamae]|nr:hypothetical protein [Salmonella enterica subsp. salamae]